MLPVIERCAASLRCAFYAVLSAAIAYAALVLVPATRDVLYSLRYTSDQAAISVSVLPGATDARLGDVLSEVAAMRTMVDRQASDVRVIAGKLDAPLAQLTASIEHVAGIREDLKPTLTNVASVTAQVSDAAPLFLDCDHNPDCAFNRFQGTTKAIERASQNFGQMSTQIGIVAPELLQSAISIEKSIDGTARTLAIGFPKIVENVGGITANLNRLTQTAKWYDRLIGYGINGAVAYRNIHPATDLTIKGSTVSTAVAAGAALGK